MLSNVLQEMACSAAARTKAYEDERYGARSGKHSKGNLSEMDAAYDWNTQCMKLLETI